MMTTVAFIITIATIVFALVALLLFKLRATTAGAVFLVLTLFLALANVKAFQFRKMAASPMTMPATTVTSAPVKEEDWAPILSSIGSLSAVQGAVVAAELGGVVSKIGFENGSTAKKGDMLVQLDTSAEEAQLRTAEADVELARSDLQRARDLTARKVISKAEEDAAESKFNRLQAIVDQMRSNIRKKTVFAPFDGQLGIRQVNVGQSIDARQPVVALTSLDPIYVDFALPQQELSKLSQGLEVSVHTDAFPGREFKGKLTAINSMVDSATRNVPLQATLENPDHVLRPGMFGKVQVELPQKHKSVVIPGSAISYAPFGDSVFVIEKKKDEKTGKETETIRQQFVRVGESRGDLVAITDGLKPGQTVVSTGVFKLRNGMAVTINNELAPKPQVNPTPVDS
ncbi:MAG TPA: efflux RND transporter periplasmic adaptor subunit [Chthoniobacterales bacterium]|nr:efflux RND transporter periplasmic adaptor subunit [Chthoniobacterales bacterium]